MTGLTAASTTVTCPAYDPSHIADGPADEPAAAFVGGTPGQFQVDDDGAATYRVPLEVVPGRAGMQPELALAYNSNGGNGPVGVGFTLSGMSAVRRCPSNELDDGRLRAVRMTRDDRFCLDGLRLVAVSGEYGADGTEYRTMPDTFVRIRSSGGNNGEDPSEYTGPDSFRVWTKEGRMHDYGTGPFASIRYGGRTRQWSLSTTRDTSGNTMEIEYQATEGIAEPPDALPYTIEQWPTAIRYGGHTNGLEHNKRVHFFYESRPDPQRGYQLGTQMRLTQRLNLIAMSTTVGGTHRTARAYKLAYNNDGSTGRSKLASITECASALEGAACKRPTTFAWRAGQAGFEPKTLQPALFDAFSGDHGWPHIVVVDANGDGRDDIMYPTHDSWKLVQSQGGDTPYAQAAATGASNDGWCTLTMPDTSQEVSCDSDAVAWPVDYDQDGRVDLLTMDKESTWRVHLSQPGGFFTAITDFAKTHGPAPDTYEYPPKSELIAQGKYMVDLDGDGARDLVEYWHQCDGCGARWKYRRHTGVVSYHVDQHLPGENLAFTQPVDIPALEGVGPEDLVVVDLDGDGKEEMLYWKADEALPTYTTLSWSHESKNASGTVAHFESYDSGLGSEVRDHSRVWLDANGDGLRDLVSAPKSGEGGADGLRPWYLWVNGGGRFLMSRLAVPPGATGDLDISEFRAPPLLLGISAVLDYDGDGREDLLVPWSYTDEFPEPPTSPWTGQGLGRFLVLRVAGDFDYFTVVDPSLMIPGGLGTVQFHYSQIRRHGPRAVDADGDGQQDLVWADYENADNQWHFSYLRHRGGGGRPDVVLAIREGANEPDGDPGTSVPPTVEIEYQPLIDSLPGQVGGRYDSGNCYRMPGVKCYNGPKYVVGRHKLDAGTTGGETSTSYHDYRKAKVLRKAHAWLGFEEHKVQTFFGTYGPITTRTFYDVGERAVPAARVPRVLEQWTYGALNKATFSSPGLWLSRTVNLWGSRGEYPVTGFGFVRRRATSEYEVEMPPEALDQFSIEQVDGLVPYTGVVQHVHDIDHYGNVLDAETVYGDGDSTRVRSGYFNDPSEWFISRASFVETHDITPQGTRTRAVLFWYPPVGEGAANLPRTIVVSSPDEPAGLAPRTTLDRDIYGNVVYTTVSSADHSQQRTSCTTYEPDGAFPHATVNAAGHVSYVKVHPVFGRPWASIDPNGLRSAWAYDQLGRPVRAEHPDRPPSYVQYFKEHIGSEWLVGRRDLESSGEQTDVLQDRLGRIVRERFVGLDGQGRVRTRSFFPQGVPAEVSLWAREGAPAPGSTTFGYDGKFRPRVVTRPDGTKLVTRYDGLTTTALGARGYPNTIVYNARGQIERAVDAKGTARTYVYGPFGELVRTRAEVPSGEVTISEIELDGYGRVARAYDADRGVKVFGYNVFGELINATDALGRQYFYEYDALGRRTHMRLLHEGSSTPAAETTYVYDFGEGKAVGKPTRVNHLDRANNQWHQLTYRYDTLGRLAKLDNVLPTDSGAGSERLRVQFAYDAHSRLSSVTYPTLPGHTSPTTVGYDYGAHGHLSAVRWGTGAQAPALWEALESDEADRVTHEFFGNAVETRRAYHPLRGLPDAVTTQTSIYDAEPGRVLQSLTYTFDDEGNLEHRADLLQGHTEHFIYDELDRLKSLTLDNEGAPRLTYDYDPLGNLTQKTDAGVYEYDPLRPHLVTKVGNETYGHDAVGNQTSRPGGVAVDYNAFDLPAGLTQGSAPLARFSYSGLGERVRKVSSVGTTTYAAGFYERQRRPDGKVEHRLLVSAPGRSVVATLRYLEQGGQSLWQSPLFVHTDHLGSTDLVTSDESNWLDPEQPAPHAVIAERRSYDPFGRPRHPDWAQTGPASVPPLLGQGFTGHDDDPELGLVNMKGRVYDPRLGRFLTPDPVVQAPTFSQSWNRYAYVFNNPLRFTDPSGFSTADPGQGIPSMPDFDEAAAWAASQAQSAAFNAWTDNWFAQQYAAANTAAPNMIVDVNVGDLLGQSSTAAVSSGPVFNLPFGYAVSPAAVGFGLGLVAGMVPGGTIVNSWGMTVAPPRDAGFEFGNGVGQIFGGIIALGGGTLGEIGGVTLSITGIGAALGVPAVAAGVLVQANGATAVVAGAAQVLDALNSDHSFSTGSESGGGTDVPNPAPHELVPSAQPPEGNRIGSSFAPGNIPKEYQPHVYDILMDIQAARSGDAAAAGRLTARNQHPLTGNWQGWTSVDIIDRSNPHRLLWRVDPSQGKPGIIFRIENTHARRF
ncbi:MAG TPA: RHS repeat-associated core domain-containing protein [Polyangiaceae bacterium]|nr:RHS repeat-associated core domain-containing protein [Polyangiaceae bacterium]